MYLECILVCINFANLQAFGTGLVSRGEASFGVRSPVAAEGEAVPIIRKCIQASNCLLTSLGLGVSVRGGRGILWANSCRSCSEELLIPVI